MQKKKILAVASKGGHLIQLMRLRSIFDRHDTIYISNQDSIDVERYIRVIDANMDSKFKLILLGIQILLLVIRYRPDVVITTGAAPGYFAVVFGHIIGSKTIWIDSIANADTLSLSGRKMARWAGLWLTQWPDLAKPDGPQYKGSVF